MAKLKLTFEEYIKSPSGKGSSINTPRDTTAQFYQTKYDAIVARDGLIRYEAYRTASDVYYIHFHIPSNSTKGFSYDTVVELSPNKDAPTNKGDLKNYLVRFYSNDPNFNFTHAHAYYSHGLIIPEFEKKLSLAVKTTKANTRNPDNAIGYVQSIYFAYLTMKKDNLFDKGILDRKASAGGFHRFGHDIPSYKEKEKEKKKFVEEQKRTSKNQKEELKPKVVSSRFIGNGISHIPIVSKVTKTARTTSSVKTTKATKRR